MKFKNIKISYLIVNLIICFAYPILKYVSADNNAMLVFTDSLTIVSFIMIILGVVYSLYLKGDFDITSYIMNHSITKNNTKPVESYMADQKKEREESFNYPLFTGLLTLIICILLNKLYF